MPSSGILSTIWNTSHTSAGRDPFASYIHIDICVHNPARKNDCDSAQVEAHHCVLLLQQCVHILVVKQSGVLTF